MTEERKWELMSDEEFVFSGTEDMVLAGFFVFSDGNLCVCSHDKELAGLETSMQGDAPKRLSWDESLDDIPF